MVAVLDVLFEFLLGRFVFCPRCLARLPLRSQVTQDQSCEHCHFVLPLAYITGCQQAPPVFVQVFGLPGSGKTTFLNTLESLLLDLDQIWQESAFYARPLTEQTMEHTTTLLGRGGTSILAASTPRSTLAQTKVLIFSLCNMPRWGSRTMVVMDHAGEQFASLNLDLEEIPFLQHTPLTILCLSLHDLIHAGRRIDDLITTYLSTLKMHGVHPGGQRRQLIIAFSKADLLSNLPSELSSYLSSDTTGLLPGGGQGNPRVSAEQLPGYLQQMQRINHAVRGWVETLPNGTSMLNMLKDLGVETRFTLISATGGPLAGSSLAPRPRRVLDPFFWMLEYHRRPGARSAVPATLSMLMATFSPTLRSAWSLLLLALCFAGSLGGSLFLARLSGGTPDLVRPGLALLALLVYVLATQWLAHPGSAARSHGQAGVAPAAPAPVVRSVLNVSRLALFLACLVAATLPAARLALTHLTISQFLQIFLVAAGLFSCLQPPARGTLSRLTLALIAGCGALLQAAYGCALEFQALHLPPVSPDTLIAITDSIVLALLVLAGLLLLILATPRNWWDRFTLWLVALVFAGLQLVYGPWELLQMFPQMLQQADLVNTILAALLILFPLAVLVYLYRFPLLDRLPLLILALACAVQVHFLGDSAVLPAGLSAFPLVSTDVHPLTTPLASLLTPGQLLAYTLLIIGGLMAIRGLAGRPAGPFVLLDHAALFFLAVLCSQLQTFPWGALVPQGHLSSLQDVLLITNHLVAGALLIQVFLGVSLALFFLLFPLARQVKRLPWLLHPLNERGRSWLTHQPWYRYALSWLNGSLAGVRATLPHAHSQTVPLSQGITWLRPVTTRLRRTRARARLALSTLDTAFGVLERLLVCTTTLACALLAELYGQVGSGTASSLSLSGVVTVNQLVALLFAVLTVITMLRIKRPPARGDRFLLLLHIGLCTLLYLGRDLPSLPLVFTWQNWNTAVAHAPGSLLLFVGLCSLTALVSFWWAERSPFPGNRRLLQILFALALAGGFLELLSSALPGTLLALLALVMGVAMAAFEARSKSAR
jgi:hypothetical protein